MLHSLEVRDYRGFEKYRLPDLGRVNLLVGRNSSGKTSLLEAVRLWASGGDPYVMTTIARRRNEVVFFNDEERSGAFPDLSHFFHGHRISTDSRFAIVPDESPDGIIVACMASAPRSVEEQYESAKVLGFSFVIAVVRTDRDSRVPFLPVDESGVVVREGRVFAPTQNHGERALPVEFITPDDMEPASMGEIWDDVLVQGREEEVHRALQVLDGRVIDIQFLSRGARSSGRGGASVVVRLEDVPTRLPLGSLGDGMRRLLMLSLGLAQSTGGVLLVDEIDTGLHYSIMEDMWRLVVETARRADVQVFATTHSLDCVKGLAALCGDYPELGEDVCLHKIDTRLEESVNIRAERLAFAVEHEIELR